MDTKIILLGLFYMVALVIVSALFFGFFAAVKKDAGKAEGHDFFSWTQRSFHKLTIIFMLCFFLTGIAMYSSTMSGVAYVIGLPVRFFTEDPSRQEIITYGIIIARGFHFVLAILYAVLAVLYTLSISAGSKKLYIMPKYGNLKDGLSDMKKVYITHEQPESTSKYNIGQMAAAWAVVVLVIALMITGFVIHNNTDGALRSAARIIHIVSFIIMGLFVVFHAIFAFLSINRAGLKAMFVTGEVDDETLKSKHPAYYKELQS